jgi:CSLREA domain-containing protein
MIHGRTTIVIGLVALLVAGLAGRAHAQGNRHGQGKKNGASDATPSDPVTPLAGATFYVTSTGDAGDASAGNGVCATGGGACTLRAAIQEANALPGLDTILFAIDSGPQTINAGSGFSVTSPLVIDGTSQPGFAGAPIIEVHGGSGNGFSISAGGSTVKGLVVNGFSGHGILLSGAGGNNVEGCYIGPDLTGTAAVGNSSSGVSISSNDNRIGGRDRSQRNVISGNTGKGNHGGVQITGGASGNIVQGNFLGTDATGMAAMGNHGRGVTIHHGSNNFIGGALQGAGNLVSANRATGIRIIEGEGNLVMGNWVGVDAGGIPHPGPFLEPGKFSNDWGVQIRSNNNTVASNYIAGNRHDGVLFFDSEMTGNLVVSNIITQNGLSGIGGYYGFGNRFTNNSVFDNAWIGIELGPHTPDGVTINDALDVDGGSNNQQNYPRLDAASSAGGLTTVTGVLNSAANTTYTVELFANPSCDASGAGEGRYPFGQFTVTTNASGSAAFSFGFGAAVPAGWFVTATATDPGNNTSEFSFCRVVG